LRLDGFASVSAPYESGEMITKPFPGENASEETLYKLFRSGSCQILLCYTQ